MGVPKCSSVTIKWDNRVPNCVILLSQLGEQWCYVMLFLKLSVFLKAEPLLTVPVLNVSVGLFHTLSAEKTGITVDSIDNIKMLSITCSHHISAPVSTLFWILYFQA